MSELTKLSTRDVFVYGAVCVERRAVEMAESMDLALVSAEALSGGSSLRKYLRCEIQRMLGEPSRPVASAVEQAAVAEVEMEIVREFPFYFDDARLSELHEQYGRLRLGGR